MRRPLTILLFMCAVGLTMASCVIRELHLVTINTGSASGGGRSSTSSAPASSPTVAAMLHELLP